MDVISILLGALALAGLGASLWLLRERTRLTVERDIARARLEDGEKLRTSFQALAGETLKTTNAEFLRLAKETLAARGAEAVAEMDKRRDALDRLIGPIQEAIRRTHEELKQVGQDSAGLRQQVSHMAASNQELRLETGKLSQALRKPNVRGRYGEIQLERVVELAGMRAYCDFTIQENLRDEDGKLQKPDLIVQLPNQRIIAVDAKTSIDGYLDALGAATPEEAEALLERYADNVLLQVQRLARKQYWTRFDSSPEFVVMFIPGDQLVDAALERRPQLLDFAASENVVIASPSTLIGLLRAVHVGWRERNLTDSAQELFELGRELHQRAGTVLEHAARVGQAIDGARRHYNELVGSVQSRLLPTLRKFEERDARSPKTIEDLPVVDGETRTLGFLPFKGEDEPDDEIPQALPRPRAPSESANVLPE